MTARMKRLLYIVLGLLAGLVTWGVEEVLIGLGGGYLVQAVIQGAALGGLFGYALGAAEGIAISEPKKALLTGLIGSGLGAVGGGAVTVASAAGMIAATNAFRADYSLTIGVLLPLSRVLAWGVVGIVVGSVEGIRSVSGRRIIVGMLAGLTGGLLGGAGLEWLLRVMPDPAIGRVTGFLVLGAALGLFLGVYEHRFSFARLKVLTGPLRNKEYVLARRRTSIGSGFSSEVYLARYPGMAPRMAELLSEGREMRLRVSNGTARVNEKPVDGVRFLKYHDVIDIGGARLLLLPATGA